MNKKEIRKEILKKRRELADEEVIMSSEIICKKISEMEVYKSANDICLYMAINNEVDPSLLIEDSLSRGKNIWLPKVDGKTMDFFRFSYETKLVIGPYGIKEPDSETMLLPDEKTLIIMPGAVFSKERDRIGYGGGYYDRYLYLNPCCKTLAIAYDFQVLEKIPAENHDIKPEYIVTESKII